MLAAAAVYLGTAAVYLIWGSIFAFGIGFPLGITLSFLSVGFALGEYDKEAMLGVITLPPALWGFMYLVSEFKFRDGHSWGWIIGLMAIVAAGKAALGGGREAHRGSPAA